MTDKNLTPKLVTIVVPVYNAEIYLKNCINSILSQTYTELELIIINDGSTDHSLDIIQTYSDPRITAISSKNQGVSAARNIGIEHATGEFLLFLDADDYLESEAIQKLMLAQKKVNSDLTVCAFNNFGHNAKKKPTVIFENNTLLGAQEITHYVKNYLNKPNRHSLFVYSWGRLFRNSIIQKNSCFFDTTLSSYEDVKFNFQTLHHIESIYYLSEPLCHYRAHPMLSSATTKLTGDPHSMFGYVNALQFSKTYLKRHEVTKNEIENLLGNAITIYTIIQLIRLCANLSPSSFLPIYRYIKQLSKREWVGNNFSHYNPDPGESVLIPQLLLKKLPLLTILACYFKARKRYT
ncbi:MULTISPECIES: glycosyltransferase [unclassified Neptuniibacter]|uniref:glycosyltransferase family 2 protein n=1 Tax=unclassified Neptuniibacter TaxID=2630693 RepID=UPI0025ECBDFA|nr:MULTISPECIES: glycosyltransferase [unclassified Neptuniibacter]|tara:strand:+ start:30475 stop:31524 length:1050 start_codon:yes stop_codon:yes gene_type:complete